MSDQPNIWIKQLNRRELGAYQMLYQHYYKLLVLYAVTFVEMEDIAQDLVQDVMVSVWEKELQFASEAALKSFLYNAVRNASLNQLRHAKVKGEYAQKQLIKGEQSFDLQKEIERNEIYGQVYAAIEKLPARCKEVFELHLQGMKNAEIAEQLKISVETVKTQKKRALSFLKQQLAPAVFVFLSSNILL